MANTFSAALPGGERHPLTAAFLSIVPGLGQLYVGERRKGILFLDVAIINFVLLGFMAASTSICNGLHGFAASYHFTLNAEFVSAMRHARLGSPCSLFIIALMVLFSLYAARDAYDQAFGIKRRQIYGDSFIEISEATSGSYLAHIALMVSCVVLAIFFVKPPARIIERSIEFVIDQQTPISRTKPPKTSPVSTQDHTKHGKQTDRSRHIADNRPENVARTQPVRTPDASQRKPQPPQPQPTRPSQPAQSAQSAAQHATLPDAPPPAPMPPTPNPIQRALDPTRLLAMAPKPVMPSAAMSAAVPQPLRPTRSLATVTNSPATPMPVLRPNSSTTRLPVGLLTPVTPQGRLEIAQPGAMSQLTHAQGAFISATPGAVSFSHATAPQVGVPSSSIAGVNSAGTARPGIMPISSGPSGAGHSGVVPIASSDTKGCRLGPAGVGVSPIRFRPANDSGNGVGAFAAAPVGKPATEGSGMTSPDTNVDNGRPEQDSIRSKFPDFTAYMADLQRRIKRQWRPPGRTQNLRAQALFTIHTDGTLSNLGLHRSSGLASYDNAAMQAIEAAVPFRHLPEGAPESVEIEFTFDLNVMKY